MLLNFYYPEIEGVKIPDKNLCGVFKPKTWESNLDVENLIWQALQQPIGTEKLEDMVKKGDRVLIVVDDNTRFTPVDKILKVLLPHLHKLGVKREDVAILIALGTHRPMSRQELVAKLGQKVVEEYKVINHLWDKKEENTYYGRTSKEIEVWGNKLLKESDFVIGLGHIVPHRVAGFSGGGEDCSTGCVHRQNNWRDSLA